MNEHRIGDTVHFYSLLNNGQISGVIRLQESNFQNMHGQTVMGAFIIICDEAGTKRVDGSLIYYNETAMARTFDELLSV